VSPEPTPVVLDPDVRCLAGGRVLLGGDPGRLVRLRTPLDGLVPGAVLPPAAQSLAATLVAGGLGHPRPGPGPVQDLVVVLPVRDRCAELARCLRALGRSAPVLVVDDASLDPGRVARVAREHGAQVLHLATNVGPGAARNAGVAATTGALVAFVDSDCLPPPGWLAALVGHFDDPAVGAVAPRVRATTSDSSLLGRYAAVRGPLDLGPREAEVHPGGRVPYVPTAALLVRRAALPTGAAFDPGLRYGEDVDLVWRLHDAGWLVRYEPRTVVEHDEPDRWLAWFARRYRYGTSAAPLARRHGARLAPLVLPAWPTAAWLLLLTRRPVGALVAAAVPAARLHLRLRSTGLPPAATSRLAVSVTGRSVLSVVTGIGGAGSVLTLPVLLALLTRPRWRAPAALALLVPPLLEWQARGRAVDPLRWTALRLLDDAAYACGVWRSCWAGRSVAALRPRHRRPT